MNGEMGRELMKKYRAERDLSQDALAAAIRAAELEDGIPGSAGASYVSQVERGINVPSRERALLIDSILGARGEIAAAFGYRPPAATVDATDPDDLAALVAELRVAVDDAAKRDVEQRQFTEVAREIVALLQDMTSMVAANKASIERIEDYVRWSEASRGRTEDPPA